MATTYVAQEYLKPFSFLLAVVQEGSHYFFACSQSAVASYCGQLSNQNMGNSHQRKACLISIDGHVAQNGLGSYAFPPEKLEELRQSENLREVCTASFVLNGVITNHNTTQIRLAQKKILLRERMGLQYEYWLSDPSSKIPSFLGQLKKKFFGVKTCQMVSYLIESADDISEGDLVEMEKMIEKAKTTHKSS